MKITEYKNQARKDLGEQYDALEVDLWMGKVLNKGKEWLFVNSDFELDELQAQEFKRGIAELKKGRPLAQLTGVKEFYGLEFKVNEHVLIPRPETELIVDLAKDYIEKNFKNGSVRILDIGTGSGCIISAVVSVLPNAKGVGLDISDDALEVAKENIKPLGLADRIEVRLGDLLNGVKEEFDVVLANLPYIGRKTFNYVAEDVAVFEPASALYAGDDGLDLYRKMFLQLNDLSWRPALMIGEFGAGQENEVSKILIDSFSDNSKNFGKKFEFTIVPDLAGIPRMFVVNFI